MNMFVIEFDFEFIIGFKIYFLGVGGFDNNLFIFVDINMKCWFMILIIFGIRGIEGNFFGC